MVHLEEYPWSSYRSYVGLVPPQDILNYRWLKLMGIFESVSMAAL
jgi:hypothetical protein